MSDRSAISLFYIAILIILLIGLGQHIYATQWGIGLFGSDSFRYVSSARNLVDGNGLYFPTNNKRLAPLTTFPPLLPGLLASFDLVGLEILVSARYFYAVLYGLSALLFVLTIYKTTHSIAFASYGGLLFITSPNLIKVYSVIMTEGPFIFLTLTGFLLFNQYLQNHRYYLVVLLGLVLGATVLARYIGVANILTILVALLLLTKGFSRKLRDMATIFFLGVFPISIWTLRNYLLVEKINNRLIGFHPPVLKNYLAIFNGFFTWFLPEKYIFGYEKALVSLSLLFGIAALLFFAVYINRKYGSLNSIPNRILRLPPLIFLFGSYIFIYIAVLLIAKTFFEPNIGFEDRIITPILLSILFLFTTLLYYLWNSRITLIKVFVIIALIYVPMFSFAQSAATIRDYHQNGIGLARREMRTSKALDKLRELANSNTVYNNNFYASYFYSGQVGYRLNHFSPVHDEKDQAVFAIYSSSAEDTFIHKYGDQLELIASDPVVSIYRFKPEP
jgi:hypothetical protein